MKKTISVLLAMLIAATIPAIARQAQSGADAAQVTSSPAPNPTDSTPTATQGPSASVASSDYRLGPADKVRIIVYGEETLSGEFSVGDGGMLSLPLIGNVEAAGRSPTEVVADIESRLADGYLLHPRVSMDVLTYRPFYILGEVNKPGTYPYSNGLTVMSAVATAEGYTYRANKRRVLIKHPGAGEETEYRLTADLKIEPGDTIRVLERHF